MTAQMKILDLQQGSSAWKGIRGQYLVASEAPVIMGASPHMRRDELLRMKKTGDEKEINSWVERFVFRPGHEAEAAARPIAEDRLGEELFPITGTRTVFGLPLLASFDGIVAPAYDDSWEHKTLNEKLRDFFDGGNGPEELPLMYAWQLEHQMLVAGTDSCVFAASNGTEDTYHEIRYHSIPERREQLIEGWRVFNQDLEAYEVKEVKPEVVAEEVESLPAVFMRAQGSVAVTHNFDVFEKQLKDFLENKFIRKPKSDADFATLDLQIKAMKESEFMLQSAGESVIAEIQEVDIAIRKKNSLYDLVRQNRLMAEKLLEAEKKNRKMEIAKEAKDQFDEHIRTLNKSLGGDWMPYVATDFNNAMKGKRTIATLENAANDELTRARIEANRIASRIEDNLTFFDSETEGYDFLFADKKTLVVGHDREPLQAIVKNRIAEHKAKEDAKAEAERQRIREEERVKAENAAAEKARKEKADQDAADKARGYVEKVPVEAAKPAESELVVKSQAESSEEVKASIESQADFQQQYGQMPMPSKMPRRPPDDGIINFLCEHYNEDAATVIGWLRTIDLDAAEKRLVKAA